MFLFLISSVIFNLNFFTAQGWDKIIKQLKSEIQARFSHVRNLYFRPRTLDDENGMFFEAFVCLSTVKGYYSFSSRCLPTSHPMFFLGVPISPVLSQVLSGMGYPSLNRGAAPRQDNGVAPPGKESQWCYATDGARLVVRQEEFLVH